MKSTDYRNQISSACVYLRELLKKDMGDSGVQSAVSNTLWRTANLISSVEERDLEEWLINWSAKLDGSGSLAGDRVAYENALAAVIKRMEAMVSPRRYRTVHRS